MSKNSEELVRIAYDALDEKLGQDIEILKIDEISVIADCQRK
jgi:ribosomal silencing factor RsfS